MDLRGDAAMKESSAANLPESERRYCYAACRNPWFNECADCWMDGGNPALYPQTVELPDGMPEDDGGVGYGTF